MAERDMERPDASYISTLTEHLKDLWRETHEHWGVIDSYYHRTVSLWTPDEQAVKGDLPEYHPARATATIDHAVDNQLAHEPRVERFPTSNAERSKRNADVIEPFVHAVFMESALYEPSLTWKQLGKNLLLYGYGVIEGPVLDSTGRPTKPRARRGEDEEEAEQRLRLWENEKRTWMPFRIRSPHPAHVLLEPTNKRPREGVKIVTRYAIDLARLTQNRIGTNGHAKRRDASATLFDSKEEPYRDVETTEYWSLDWHALVADGDLLFVEPNTWGFLPFKHAFAGFGQPRTESDSVEVRYLAVGILDPILDSLRVQMQALTGMHNSLIEASFPDRIVLGDAESIRNQKARGARILQMKQGESMTFEQPPDISRWMFEAERLVDFDIEFGSFARNMAGMRQVGTYTVGQTAIQMNAAEKKFLGTGLQMEQLATLVGQDILKLVDLLDEPLTVRGHTIRPSDLEHDYSLAVRFELVDPVLEMQRRQVGQAEVAQGLKSKETYWNDIKLADVSGERMRILEDRLRENPVVQQAFIEEMARLFGLIPLLEQIEKQRAASAGAGVPPTAPATGAGGEQGTIFGPDGKPLQQSMGAPPDQSMGAPPDVASLQQMLTGQVSQPSRVGQAGAGSGGAGFPGA